jgi:protein TonB
MINTKFNLYKAEWLDLVFADRNKSYGAYDLRIHYGANMMRALAITVIGFTVAAVSVNIALKHNHQNDTHTIITDVVLPHYKTPPVEQPKEAVLRKHPAGALNKQMVAAPKVNVPSQRFVEPVPTNEPVLTDIKPIDANKAIASIDNKGDVNKGVINSVAPVGPVTSGDPKGTPEGTTNDPVDIGGLDIMPEPYGGAAAWGKFLQKNLRYPDTELQGRVIISFIIEKDGKLTDLNIIKGVDNLLDREALRVLKLAPAWKPGQQNGKPVRVKYTIPIVFQMSEQ